MISGSASRGARSRASDSRRRGAASAGSPKRSTRARTSQLPSGSRLRLRVRCLRRGWMSGSICELHMQRNTLYACQRPDDPRARRVRRRERRASRRCPRAARVANESENFCTPRTRASRRRRRSRSRRIRGRAAARALRHALGQRLASDYRGPGTPRSSRTASCSPCSGRSAPRRRARRGSAGFFVDVDAHRQRCGDAPVGCERVPTRTEKTSR